LNYRVVDEQGKELAVSRDLGALRQELGDRSRRSFVALAQSPLDRDGLTDWSMGELPESIQVARRGATITGFPAVLDEGRTVSVRVLESAKAAAQASRAGLRRLFMLQARDELNYQYRLLVGIGTLAMQYSTLGTAESFREHLELLIAELAFLGPETPETKDRIPVRTKAQFDRALIEGTDRIGRVGAEVCGVVAEILSGYQRVRLRLDQGGPWTAAIADMKKQVELLLPERFLAETPWDRLRHVPRYLAAIEMRIAKLQSHAARDAEQMRAMQPVWNAYVATLEQCKKAGIRSATLEEFRWLLEELRVGLFAQELRTAVTVSVPRLERIWGEIKL
jgi:ATP-dependent helicase HrpA